MPHLSAPVMRITSYIECPLSILCATALLYSEYESESGDESYDGRGGDVDEDRERLKRRKFIMDEFRRRSQVI